MFRYSSNVTGASWHRCPSLKATTHSWKTSSCFVLTSLDVLWPTKCTQWANSCKFTTLSRIRLYLISIWASSTHQSAMGHKLILYLTLRNKRGLEHGNFSNIQVSNFFSMFHFTFLIVFLTFRKKKNWSLIRVLHTQH